METKPSKNDLPATQLKITRPITIPDQLRLARYKRAPELGPRILFFSGGTALNKLSRILTTFTHNSIHLVTPFDSGGSSAKLRDAFNMLSVGDMRSRLMALADRSVTGHPEIYNLFVYRLPKDQPRTELKDRLKSMVEGGDPLVANVPDPMRKIIRAHLRFFYNAMPESFDLRGASIGNLILAGGYLNNNRHIDPVVFMFSKLVDARGIVRTITGQFLHLVAELENGETIRGQKNLTGKEVPPINSKVKNVFLTDDLDGLHNSKTPIRRKIRDLISMAELICYPVGSFYSSVTANLLPEGVTNSILDNHCPKIYIPNMGIDPEQFGMTVSDCVETLIRYLKQNSVDNVSTEKLLNFVIVDSKYGDYPGGLDLEEIRRQGVEVIDTPLVTESSRPLIDEKRLIEVVLSLT
ncbi:MAG: GAK system CofD-like protein [candidate division Zixibacteria bacterium]|nr:GAK system CofD-like protein [candidate division Zixibacteria bacterium]